METLRPSYPHTSLPTWSLAGLHPVRLSCPDVLPLKVVTQSVNTEQLLPIAPERITCTSCRHAGSKLIGLSHILRERSGSMKGWCSYKNIIEHRTVTELLFSRWNFPFERRNDTTCPACCINSVTIIQLLLQYENTPFFLFTKVWNEQHCDVTRSQGRNQRFSVHTIVSFVFHL